MLMPEKPPFPLAPDFSQLLSQIWDVTTRLVSLSRDDRDILEALLDCSINGLELNPVILKRYDLSAAREETTRELFQCFRNMRTDPALYLKRIESFPEVNLSLVMGLFLLLQPMYDNHRSGIVLKKCALSPRLMHIDLSGPRAFSAAVASQQLSPMLSRLIDRSIFVTCQDFPASVFLPDLVLNSDSIGLASTDPVPMTAQKILRFHFARLLHHQPGARLGENPEELHKMRVAARRMRTAIRVFQGYFPESTLEPFFTALKDITGILGQVRNLDVFRMVIFEEENGPETLPFADNNPVELDQFLQISRHRAREVMLTHLNSTRYNSFLENFHTFLNTALPFDQDSAGSIGDEAPRFILNLKNEINLHRMGLIDTSLEGQHKLRIKIKRLRYIVEFLADILGESREEIILELKDIQDHLGVLNDAKELINWIDNLSEEKVHITDPQTRDFIDNYRTQQENQKAQILSGLPDVWKHFDSLAFQKEFSDLLDIRS